SSQSTLIKEKFTDVKYKTKKLIETSHSIYLSADIWPKKNHSDSFLEVTMQIFNGTRILSVALDLRKVPQPHINETVLKSFSKTR
ncbi:MAG: hypothetical protein MHPSP_004002, partial [Paramarteilia canceri]